MSTKAPILTLELRRRADANECDSSSLSDKELAIRLMAEVTKLRETSTPRATTTDLDGSDRSDDDDDDDDLEEPSSPPPPVPQIGVFDSPHLHLEEEPNWEEEDVFPAEVQASGDDGILFDDGDDMGALLSDEPTAAAPRGPSLLSMSADSSLSGSSVSSMSDLALAGNPFASALALSSPLFTTDVDPEPVWRSLLARFEQNLEDSEHDAEYAALQQKKGDGKGIDYEHTFEATKANSKLNRFVVPLLWPALCILHSMHAPYARSLACNACAAIAKCQYCIDSHSLPAV
jgi:hypothetical protein